MELDEDDNGKRVIHFSGIGGWIIAMLAVYGAIALVINIYSLAH